MLAGLLLLLTEIFPATIADPGFDRDLRAWGMTGHRSYRADVASNYPARPAHRWLNVGWAARNRAPDDAEYRVFTFVDARRYRGRLVRFSASIRTRGRGASLDAVTEGASVRSPLRTSHEWDRQGVILRVPRDADTIQLGFHLRSGASLDADDVRLEVLR